MYQLGQNRCCWSKVGVLMAPKNPMAFLWYKCHIMGAFLWVCHVRRGGLSQNIVTSPQEEGIPVTLYNVVRRAKSAVWGCQLSTHRVMSVALHGQLRPPMSTRQAGSVKRHFR